MVIRFICKHCVYEKYFKGYEANPQCTGCHLTLMYGIIVSVCRAQFPYGDMYPEIAANLEGEPRD